MYYICQQKLPLDPDKNHFDWISIDGACNVQYYPISTVLTGIEHTVTLLFGRLMSICLMNEMCDFAKREVFWFVRHVPHEAL